MAQAGSSGSSGSSGTSGLNGSGFTWMGTWNIFTNYLVNEVVEYTGSSYICIQNTIGQDPTDTSYWSLMAQAGSNGTSGSSGSSGTSGTNGTSGTSGLSFSGGSGNCITDLYVTNIHGCSPVNVQDDIVLNADVFIPNITSGGSSTYLTIDSDTGQLYTAQASGGSTMKYGSFFNPGQSISVNTFTQVDLTTTGYTSNMYLSSNTVIVPTAGIYKVSIMGKVSMSLTGIATFYYRVNGSTIYTFNVGIQASDDPMVTYELLVNLAANDAVGFHVQYNQTGGFDYGQIILIQVA